MKSIFITYIEKRQALLYTNRWLWLDSRTHHIGNMTAHRLKYTITMSDKCKAVSFMKLRGWADGRCIVTQSSLSNVINIFEAVCDCTEIPLCVCVSYFSHSYRLFEKRATKMTRVETKQTLTPFDANHWSENCFGHRKYCKTDFCRVTAACQINIGSTCKIHKRNASISGNAQSLSSNMCQCTIGYARQKMCDEIARLWSLLW